MNAEIAALIETLPEGGKNAPADAAPARNALAKLAARGPATVPEIVALLKPAETGGDTKVRLALHNLATHAAQQDDAARSAFATALAQCLDEDRPAEVQAFIIRQLQLCGGAEVVPALGKRLNDEQLGEPAAAALVAIRTGAAEVFRSALGASKGRMQLVVVQSLGVLRDTEAAELLRPLVEHDEQAVRLAAAAALARAGGAADAKSLVALARREEGMARAQAIDACFELAELLGTAGKTTERVALLRDLEALGQGTYVAHAASRQIERARR